MAKRHKTKLKSLFLYPACPKSYSDDKHFMQALLVALWPEHPPVKSQPTKLNEILIYEKKEDGIWDLNVLSNIKVALGSDILTVKLENR